MSGVMPQKTGASDGTAKFSLLRFIARSSLPSNCTNSQMSSAYAGQQRDASDYTRSQNVKAILKNYNDTQFKGGDGGQSVAINRVRH